MALWHRRNSIRAFYREWMSKWLVMTVGNYFGTNYLERLKVWVYCQQEVWRVLGKDSYDAFPHLWGWLCPGLPSLSWWHQPCAVLSSEGEGTLCPVPATLLLPGFLVSGAPGRSPWPGPRTETLSWAELEKALPPRARPFAGARACSVLSIWVCRGHRPFGEGHPRSVHAWTALSFS